MRAHHFGAFESSKHECESGRILFAKSPCDDPFKKNCRSCHIYRIARAHQAGNCELVCLFVFLHLLGAFVHFQPSGIQSGVSI